MGKIVFYDYRVDDYIRAILEHVNSVICESKNVEKIIGELSKVLIKYQHKVAYLTVIEAVQSVLANITASFLAQIPKEHKEKMKIALDLIYKAKLIEYEKIIKNQENQKLGVF